MQSFLTGEMYWLSFRLRKPSTNLAMITLDLMNVVQWNVFFNKYALSVFSGVTVFPDVL